MNVGRLLIIALSLVVRLRNGVFAVYGVCAHASLVEGETDSDKLSDDWCTSSMSFRAFNSPGGFRSGRDSVHVSTQIQKNLEESDPTGSHSQQKDLIEPARCRTSEEGPWQVILSLQQCKHNHGNSCSLW